MRQSGTVLTFRRLICLGLSCWMVQLSPAVLAQQAPSAINLVIVEGAGAINNIRQRTAREPIVQVEDENNQPVPGATVVFLLPESGPGGSFPGGAQSLTVTTDQNGQAVARGLTHNGLEGKYEIQVNATYEGLEASSTIAQANAVLTAAAGGISGKLIAILVAVGGAAAAGTIVALQKRNNGSGNGLPGQPPSQPPVTITPGTPSVGGPP